MSRDSDEISNVSRIVVFFDVCSSTTILEDLLRTEKQRQWRNLLIGLKEFLVDERSELSFEIYKFLGDGWILLFDPEHISGSQLMELLERVCHKYAELFQDKIYEVLESDIDQVGLTIGIDSGKLVKIRMDGSIEYIGRALNIAARLQSSIKQKDKMPAGKLLISKHAFADLELAKLDRYKGTLVYRRLSNVTGGERFPARKIIVYKKRIVPR